MTMSEFETLLGRVDAVAADVAQVKVTLASHCAAEDAVAKLRRPTSAYTALVANGIALLSLATAAVALFAR
jgi:hypothetical protein